MTRPILYISGALSLTLALALAAGCSSPSGPSAPPQVNYTRGNTYVYTEQKLDANTGEPTGAVDTVTSVVIQTGMTYQGRTNVTEIQNTHTNGSAPDTSYIAQSNGEYWHLNYGLEALNTNPAVLAAVGAPIQAGWVLQSNFSASAGQKWLAADTTLHAMVFGSSVSTTLTDSATETGDTTVTSATLAQNASSTAMTTYHTKHTVGLYNIGGGTADTYVSAQYGPVLDIVHPSVLMGTAAPGRITILIKAP